MQWTVHIPDIKVGVGEGVGSSSSLGTSEVASTMDSTYAIILSTAASSTTQVSVCVCVCVSVCVCVCNVSTNRQSFLAFTSLHLYQ